MSPPLSSTKAVLMPMLLLRHVLSLSFILILLAGPVSKIVAADWTQFRGPGGQGHATATGLPVHFGEKQNVTWKTPIPGRGWSSPVILGNQIWMTTATQQGHSLRAVCVDRSSGRLLHNVEVFHPANPVSINARNSHASPTPVIEKGRVYVCFGRMGTACLSTRTGKVLWRNTELQLVHKEGPGSSPILFGNRLILDCDGKDVQYVVALDTQTGRIAWKTNRSAPLRTNLEFRKAYATPLVITAGGRPQVICPGPDQVNAYNPQTGRELWRVRYIGFSNVPRPLYADGVVYICTGYFRPSMLAIRIDGQGDVTDSRLLWRYRRSVPLVPSPILVSGRIYMVSDGGVATCLNARTGKQHWQRRLGGRYAASLIEAAGHIYFSADDGRVIVISATQKYRQLAVNRLDGRLMASPAVVGNALILRTDTHLYRIESPGRTRGK